MSSPKSSIKNKNNNNRVETPPKSKRIKFRSRDDLLEYSKLSSPQYGQNLQKRQIEMNEKVEELIQRLTNTPSLAGTDDFTSEYETTMEEHNKLTEEVKRYQEYLLEADLLQSDKLITGSVLSNANTNEAAQSTLSSPTSTPTISRVPSDVSNIGNELRLYDDVSGSPSAQQVSGFLTFTQPSSKAYIQQQQEEGNPPKKQRKGGKKTKSKKSKSKKNKTKKKNRKSKSKK